ncbi:MAG: hypothetical protein Ct9H300mP30_0560 [Methanobacteriota archaeon]|nr:MAG: hypothetical protein Ct9H300mP30_0560 [Euryarchaeota archaeon]
MRSVTHLWTYIEGMRTWVYLPETYWESDSDEERMEIGTRAWRRP